MTVRRLLRIGTLCAVLPALAGGAWVAANRLYVGRILTYPFDAPATSVEWYEPREPVPGEPREPLATVPPGESPIDRAALEAAAAWAEERSSIALVVLHRGRVVLERYWRSWGPERPSQSFSLAKTAVGLLVGIAIEEGRLGSLDDPVGRHLPEWADDVRGTIRIGDLLRMQSGLRYDNDRTDPFSDMARVHVGADLEPVVLAIPAMRPPGEEWEYNNLNTQLLGLILERATGERYASYLSSRLWRPIGARDASVWLDRRGGNAKTYCCLFATARDWARVGQLLLDGGEVGGRRVVPREWIERMREPSELTRRYGLHLWLRAGGADDPPGLRGGWYWLDGKAKQRVWVVPDAELVIVRLGEDPDDWSDRFLPLTLARGLAR